MPRRRVSSPAAPGDTDALVGVLGPLARLLRAGPRVAAEAGRSGLPPLLCELLKRPPALAALPLLQALRAIYEHHPRPKVPRRVVMRSKSGFRV